jgi:hypothetical protein
MLRPGFSVFSRVSVRRAHLAAVVSVGFLTALSAGAKTADAQIISAGSGANSYYFALDFRDFATPQFYTFEYKSNSTSLLFSDVLQGLTSVPTFSIQTHVDPNFGLSLDGIAYAGKTKFNDFNGNNSGEPNGYWSQWQSTNGTAWSYTDFGIGSQSVAAGQWVGASWTANFLTTTDTAPRVAASTGAALEPGTFTLLSVGGITGAGIVLRRRRKTSGK